MQIARWLHLLRVVPSIGSMFFAHRSLRPALQALPPAQRPPLPAGEWERAGAAMAQVRKRVAVNLVLGLLTITVAVLGR